MLKLVTFTTSPDELKPMIGLLRRLYHGRRVEGLSILWGQAEWDLDVNPFVQRYYSEYSLDERPEEVDSDWLQSCVERVVWEEQPQVIIVPNGSPHYVHAVKTAHQRGARSLHWPQETYRGEPSLPVDAVGLLSANEASQVNSGVALCSFAELEEWLFCKDPEPAPEVILTPDQRDNIIERHWETLLQALPPGPISCPERGLPQIEESLRLHLFSLARHPDPRGFLLESLKHHPTIAVIEVINHRFAPGDRAFRYGEYDYEFALAAAECDLRELCRSLPGVFFQARILNPGSGCAGKQQIPILLLTLSRKPLEEKSWWQRFALPAEKKLNIVLADSMNMAGSLANHCLTINRYTQHNAVGLCTEEHPWICYPQAECRLEHVSAKPSKAVLEALEAADGFVFFEDDDEQSPSWPINLRPFVNGKPVIHVYIGYRVHKKVSAMQRPGRTVLTPLPHIMRMVPGAHFYAGFPPASLYDVPLTPPRSQEDGVLRVLQTPSMPHKILSRFVYHKDTEAYLAACRELKARFKEVEFWQLGGLPHDQILRARQLCDITLNHLRGYISLSGDEALYFKRPLVHAFDQYSINRHKEYWGLETPFPWLTATPETLADVFEQLLNDPQLRSSLGEAGHQFIKDYFAPELGILPLVWHLARAPLVSCEP